MNAQVQNSNLRFGDAANDNRRKIIETRFQVAGNGNESGQCNGGGGTCDDGNANCPAWASHGFCSGRYEVCRSVFQYNEVHLQVAF